MSFRSFSVVLVGFVLLILSGCKLKDDVEDLIEKPPPRPIPLERLGLNSFFNDEIFGSLSYQVQDIFKGLKIRRLRLLKRWDDIASPSPSSPPDFTFLKTVLETLPSSADVLLVTTGIPKWMERPENWIDANPRRTFIEKWFIPLLGFLKNYPVVRSIQVWNEPNDSGAIENKVMRFDIEENYLELCWLARRELGRAGLNLRLLNGATTAINQRGNSPLKYNRKLVSLGLRDLIDVFAIHFYGTQLQEFVKNDGVREFLRKLNMEIWVTESGERGVSKQLDYASRYWPYLIREVSTVKRIYIYTYAERESPARTYGLRNPSSEAPYSDLYLYLRGAQ